MSTIVDLMPGDTGHVFNHGRDLRVYFNVLIGSAMLVIALIGYWLYRNGAAAVPK